MSKQILEKLIYSNTLNEKHEDYITYKMKYLSVNDQAHVQDVLVMDTVNLTKEQKQYIDDNFPSKEINAYYSSALKTPKRSFNKNSKYLLCTIPEFILD
jgi:hypothetical protein